MTSALYPTKEYEVWHAFGYDGPVELDYYKPVDQMPLYAVLLSILGDGGNAIADEGDDVGEDAV
jgi:hypothetical protein